MEAKKLDMGRESPFMLARPPKTQAVVPRSQSLERPLSTTHKLIVDDARRVTAARIGPVELVATSPPYWTIVDYGVEGQVGFGQSLPDYLSSLEKVWRTCHAALRDGCRLVINIGDQYLRARRGSPYQIVPLHALIVNSIQHLSNCKFLYLGSIVWRKVSTTHTSGGGSVMGSYPYPRAVYPCFENEFIAIFRKDGKAPRPRPEVRDAARLSIEEWRDLTQGVWTFPGARMDENPASFPEELPSRLLQMFTFPGETVLDPFVGSGTTMLAAASLGRNSVGIDIGFRTASGRPFEAVIREKVTRVERKAAYSGRPSFSLASGIREPYHPQESHE
jgi:modification methylase